MPKLISKITASLLAPVIFGAVCLSCLIQPLSVLAAPVPVTVDAMVGGNVCADYKEPLEMPESEAVLAVDNSGAVIISSQGIAPFAEHDTNCRITGHDAVTDTKISPLSQYQTVASILSSIISDIPKPNDQNALNSFCRKKPDKTDLITGSVFKLE